MRKPALLLAVMLVSGCDAAERLSSPTAEIGGRLSTSTTCAQPAIVSPTNSQLVYGSSTVLKWTVATCRTPDNIEVYNNATGTLVFSDASPGWKTFLMSGDVFEYTSLSLSGYQPGQYYKWRVRSKLQSDGVNPEVIGPWSGYGVFGIPLSAPSTSASVQSGSPSLAWGAVTGASSYKIQRMVDEVGYWDQWDTASGTSYSDAWTDVTGYLGTSQPYSGKWVAYRVRAVSSSGIESSPGVNHYFSYTGIIVH